MEGRGINQEELLEELKNVEAIHQIKSTKKYHGLAIQALFEISATTLSVYKQTNNWKPEWDISKNCLTKTEPHENRADIWRS